MALSEKEELELLELENENAQLSAGNPGESAAPQESREAPEVGAGEAAKALLTGTLGQERVQELGGPLKAAYKTASVPSRELTRGLKAIVAKIPDPETQSAATNFALGIPETIGEIGAEIGGGSISPEALLLAAIPAGAISGPMAKASASLKAVLEKRLPALSQALTGVSKKYFAKAFREPGVLLPEVMGGPKGLRAAGEAVGAAERSAFGNAAKATAREINDPALTTARRNATKAAEELQRLKAPPERDALGVMIETPGRGADPETGALMLKGKRGTRAQLESPATSGSKKALLTQQEEELNQYLADNFPQVKGAISDYFDSVTRSKLMGLLPVLKSGDPSISRLVLTALGRTAGIPFGASVPAVNAGANALAGLSLTALERIAAASPRLAGPIQALIAQKKGQQNAE